MANLNGLASIATTVAVKRVTDLAVVVSCEKKKPLERPPKMRPITIIVDNYIFRLSEGSLEGDNSRVEYHPDTQELVLTFLNESDIVVTLPVEGPTLTLGLRQIEVHLSASVARDLVERLPPEVLH